ncbi:hypothetical protein [Pseudoteredinibacter isoporae]|uniref:Uncharacterized protein n=1 Tax=Pseudoteredinibacter isoporae TaxID=570281 RepID=A0A7X0JW25_9GAMM|nr:hypothetical protein [Pseudoteredinibacter isoporae]MBB6523252.1 hypothetical protein [Pseudoteredinibacter isoporae]NHO88768.1 hypothetical protein [Pseudoteredinibacter isoporae]NIB22541.1 hypothetical protein [Pseudoteredinibacter isoporae]
MTNSSSDRPGIQWDHPNQDAETIIRELATRHNLDAHLSEDDYLGTDVAYIAGDDVTLDDVEKLLVNIAKLKIYNGLDISKLHARYLRELKSKSHTEGETQHCC